MELLIIISEKIESPAAITIGVYILKNEIVPNNRLHLLQK